MHLSSKTWCHGSLEQGTVSCRYMLANGVGSWRTSASIVVAVIESWSDRKMTPPCCPSKICLQVVGPHMSDSVCSLSSAPCETDQCPKQLLTVLISWPQFLHFYYNTNRTDPWLTAMTLSLSSMIWQQCFVNFIPNSASASCETLVMSSANVGWYSTSLTRRVQQLQTQTVLECRKSVFELADGSLDAVSCKYLRWIVHAFGCSCRGVKGS